MPILVSKNTRVLVQGITGKQGRFHTESMLSYGTKIVAGVTPGKGGTEVYGVPVYDTVYEALREHHVDASIIFVPAPYALDAAMEAMNAGIKLLVVITEHIPIHDSVKMMEYAEEHNCTIIGPNTPGIIVPNETKIGVMPHHVFKFGTIGIVSRSGTLTYEIASQLTSMNFGQSTCIGIGGDAVTGLSFIDVIKLYNSDKETKAIVVIGEIGGTAEEDAAEYIKDHVDKPVIAFIAGRYAPKGKKMGHAGAIIDGGLGLASTKIDALRRAGCYIADTPSQIPKILKEVM